LLLLAVPIIYVHFASKYLLLAQPALALMIFSYFSSPWLRRIAAFSLVPMLALSLSVAWADFSFAELYRREAERVYRTDLRAALTQKISPERAVWFTGHWGWQYYMEKWGGLPLPLVTAREWAPQPGDLIVTSSYASAGEIQQPLSGRLELRESWGRTIPMPLRTMNPRARSGFYSNHWGPLPFNFSSGEAERFNYYLVKPETKLAILP
ncbi:MAG TPA: hypothetical protein VFW62_08550, partial [bacterium]|nr:hypothetical protein [bacterium]